MRLNELREEYRDLEAKVGGYAHLDGWRDPVGSVRCL